MIGDNNGRRLVLGLAGALALHEIFAALVPLHQATIREAPVETITIAKIVKIEHRPKPTPKPTPRPTPTPQPVVHTKVIAETHTPTPVINPGSPSQNHHIRRIASARPLVHTRYHSKPVAHIPVGGHGAGTSRTATANTGGIGPGGNGTGVSGSGNGTGGAPAAHEPCGFVEFIPTDQPHIDSGTGRVWENVEVRVHFPDGTTQTQVLDYPFYYAAISQDPFADRSVSDPTFQFPPSGQRAGEPELVQYVMAHSTGDGVTRLKDCPK